LAGGGGRRKTRQSIRGLHGPLLDTTKAFINGVPRREYFGHKSKSHLIKRGNPSGEYGTPKCERLDHSRSDKKEKGDHRKEGDVSNNGAHLFR